ncbi:MAG: carboxylesterase family protein [Lachnospiraceae bacterium]|nr:carboxylesterase family protein [Lachnospiraceae bacterium]
MAVDHVKTKEGIVHGVPMDGYTLFKGVPFAKPPVGELRFEPPVDPEPYIGGEYYATQWPKMAPQHFHEEPDSEGVRLYTREFYSNPEFSVPASEDCLYLNIWTPAATGEEKLPVAMWIHGGGLEHGWCSEMEFDGAAYAAKGVILVSVAYRVNVFGFFYSEEQEARIGHSGNQGHLDQVQALRWIHENIAAFGGDPENVTVFGQSAGAMSTQAMVITPLTRGLLKGAILQSGGGVSGMLGRGLSREEAAGISEEVMQRCGVSGFDGLKKVPAAKLYRVAEEMMAEHMGLIFIHNVDGYMFTGSLEEMTENRTLAEIPYMIGSTGRDIFVNKGDDYRKGGLYLAAVDYAERLERLGYPPVYVYEFTHDLPGNDDGPFHSTELWYTFGSLGRCWRPMGEADYALSERMVTAWTSFMKSGDPNGSAGKDGAWRPYTKADPFVETFA